MGMSKEEFVEKMMRNEYGKRQTKLNNVIKDGRHKHYNADAYVVRAEGRIKATKNMPNSKSKRY